MDRTGPCYLQEQLLGKAGLHHEVAHGAARGPALSEGYFTSNVTYANVCYTRR